MPETCQIRHAENGFILEWYDERDDGTTVHRVAIYVDIYELTRALINIFPEQK
jgi:hypothetical protein